MRDFVGETNHNFVNARLKSGLTQKAWEDCKSRFQIFHVLNFIMYTEALKGFDELDDCGMLRFMVKRCYKTCESVWSKYQSTMKRSMDKDTWMLMQDYVTSAWNDIGDKLQVLEISCSNYMLKHKHRNARVLSYFVSSYRVSSIIERLWDKFFRTYEKICGLDFSRSFAYADMTKYGKNLKIVIDELSKVNPPLNFANDEKCVSAMAIVERRLGDEDFLNDAARRAIGFSERFKKEYKGDIMEIENGEDARSEDVQADTFSRLSSKFKVVKNKKHKKNLNIKSE